MAVDKNKKETKKKKSFMKDFKAELKRVTWLTPKQLINNTSAVIVIVLITAVIVFALDLTFKAVNTYGINKLKAAVEAIHSDDEESTDEESTIEETEEAENIEIDEEIPEDIVDNSTEETADNAQD